MKAESSIATSGLFRLPRVALMLAGPSGIEGSGTTSCGLYCPSATSRRLTMVPETLIVCPVVPEVKVTV